MLVMSWNTEMRCVPENAGGLGGIGLSVMPPRGQRMLFDHPVGEGEPEKNIDFAVHQTWVYIPVLFTG